MLDAYIIDAIRKEELERERELERRRVWLELPLPPPPERRDPESPTSEQDGPIVIPFIPEISEREEDAA
jgi:hypothetical protein